MTEDQIKHMVNRFLGWRLPEDFSPDAGISFKPTFNDHLPTPTRHEPTGTNLFCATQAEAMVRYMLDGLPEATLTEETARLKERVRVLEGALEKARTYVELTYSEEGGEEAAEAKYDLDTIDYILGPRSHPTPEVGE